MRKRWIACAILMMACLVTLTSCGGKNLSGTEWSVAGYVDTLGNEQASVTGTFSSLAIAFFDKGSGALRMEGVSYPFTYESDDGNLKVTLQDGYAAQIRIDGKKIYLTIGDTTLFFNKK